MDLYLSIKLVLLLAVPALLVKRVFHTMIHAEIVLLVNMQRLKGQAHVLSVLLENIQVKEQQYVQIVHRGKTQQMGRVAARHVQSITTIPLLASYAGSVLYAPPTSTGSIVVVHLLVPVPIASVLLIITSLVDALGSQVLLALAVQPTLMALGATVQLCPLVWQWQASMVLAPPHNANKATTALEEPAGRAAPPTPTQLVLVLPASINAWL